MTLYEIIEENGILGLTKEQRKVRDYLLDINFVISVSLCRMYNTGLNIKGGVYTEIFRSENGQTLRVHYMPTGGVKF